MMQSGWKLFQDYIIELVTSVPAWVFIIALGIFIGGSVFIIRSGKKGKTLTFLLLLFVYYLLLLCSTVIFREARTTLHHGFDPFWHYKAFGQGKWLLLPEAVMNVLVFIPIGLALCSAFRRIRWWQTMVIGMALSVGIELLQLVFKRGCADIDDVIHNTLGCVIGYGLYWAVARRVYSATKLIADD